jgi:hypothetical protein
MRVQTSTNREYTNKDTVFPGHVPSTGSMGTLPMTDDEKEEAAEKAKTRMVGFRVEDE